jgi:hypothetical protein
MVDFNDENRTMRSEQICAANQNLALAAFHVDLDQLRRRISGGDELIESGDRHVNHVATGEDRLLAVSLDAALRETEQATAKRDLRRGGAGPDRRVHHLKSLPEVVAVCMLSQTLNVGGIGVEGHDATSMMPTWRIGADDSRGAQGQRTEMRANVVDHVTRLYDGRDSLLHSRLVLAAPEAGFFRDAQTQPQTARESGLDLKPNLTTREEALAQGIPAGVEF